MQNPFDPGCFGKVLQGDFIHRRPVVRVKASLPDRRPRLSSPRSIGTSWQPRAGTVLRKTALQPDGRGITRLPASFEYSLGTSSAAQWLPRALQARLESELDHDLSAVRIHVGPEANAIGARAFAAGTHLYFAPNQYRPTTQAGLHLLTHELAHVVQQQRGLVRHPDGRGLAVVQDPLLERQADQAANRVLERRWGALAQVRPLRSVAQPSTLGRYEQCSSCGTMNPPGATMCQNCMSPIQPMFDGDEDDDLFDEEQEPVEDPLMAAASDIEDVLSSAGVVYAVQGSFAALLHGAEMREPPGDIDILVKNLKLASTKLVQSGRFGVSQGGSHAVNKLLHLATGVEIDVVFGEEFGILLSNDTVTQRSGISVLTLTEVLVSLLLRPERRTKEMIAFASLVLTHGDEADHDRVVKIAKILMGNSVDWDALVDNAKQAARHFNL